MNSTVALLFGLSGVMSQYHVTVSLTLLFCKKKLFVFGMVKFFTVDLAVLSKLGYFYGNILQRT
jgi:hypothetical protein